MYLSHVTHVIFSLLTGPTGKISITLAVPYILSFRYYLYPKEKVSHVPWLVRTYYFFFINALQIRFPVQPYCIGRKEPRATSLP
jgi:hypothetical protein